MVESVPTAAISVPAKRTHGEAFAAMSQPAKESEEAAQGSSTEQ